MSDHIALSTRVINARANGRVEGALAERRRIVGLLRDEAAEAERRALGWEARGVAWTAEVKHGEARALTAMANQLDSEPSDAE